MHFSLGQQFCGAIDVLGFDQCYLRVFTAQVRDQGVALGQGQFFTRQLLKIFGGFIFFCREQDKRVHEIRATEIEGVFPGNRRADGRDDVGFVLIDHLDHAADAVRVLYLEAQSGTQANHLQQIGGNAPEVAVGIKECQRCQGFVDHHFYHRVQGQPALFAF